MALLDGQTKAAQEGSAFPSLWRNLYLVILSCGSGSSSFLWGNAQRATYQHSSHVKAGLEGWGGSWHGTDIIWHQWDQWFPGLQPLLPLIFCIHYMRYFLLKYKSTHTLKKSFNINTSIHLFTHSTKIYLGSRLPSHFFFFKQLMYTCLMADLQGLHLMQKKIVLNWHFYLKIYSHCFSLYRFYYMLEIQWRMRHRHGHSRGLHDRR